MRKGWARSVCSGTLDSCPIPVVPIYLCPIPVRPIPVLLTACAPYRMCPAYLCAPRVPLCPNPWCSTSRCRPITLCHLSRRPPPSHHPVPAGGACAGSGIDLDSCPASPTATRRPRQGLTVRTTGAVSHAPQGLHRECLLHTMTWQRTMPMAGHQYPMMGA